MTYPIVEYAHKIGKNTAEFTSTDMVRFQAWWMKHPSKVIVEAGIKKQLKRVVAIHQQSEKIKQEERMGTTIKSVKLQAAQTSRLPVDIMGENITNAIEEMVEEYVEDTKSKENETVCSMELTRADVISLIWGLQTLLNEYDFEGNDMSLTFNSLLEGLRDV